jgi:hypothetical protein
VGADHDARKLRVGRTVRVGADAGAGRRIGDGPRIRQRRLAAAGVRQIWFHQGAESPAALEACRELGLDAVHGECILMFAGPVGSVHKFHRWVLKLVGRLPG